METVPAGDGLPAMPAIGREMHKAAAHDQDAIIFWMGIWRRGKSTTGWTHFTWDTKHEDDHPHAVLGVSADTIERMLAPLAHESRIRIMQAMYDGPKTSGEITAETGLKGGNLYYHLRELMHAAYVSEKDGAYDLTGLGAQMLLTVAHIARGVGDRLDEGLPIGGHGERNEG